jgi:PPIC-type PPIASE domain/SurA N-terminal domain
MSKQREKTTALPQVKKSAPKPKRAEREARAERLAIIAFTGLVGLLVAVLLAAGFADGIVAPSQPVASVNGQVIPARDFERRARFERFKVGLELAPIANSQFAQQVLSNPQFGPYADMYQSLQVPSIMAQDVVAQMIDDLVIAQYAKENNITVDAADIDNRFFAYFDYRPTPMTETPTTTPSVTPTPLVSATPTPTETPTVPPTATVTLTPTAFPTGIPTATPGPTEQFTTFDKNRTEYVTQAGRLAGLAESDLREFFLAQALREKVRKTIVGEPQPSQEQVKIRLILLRSPEEAQKVLTALQNGESFSALAQSLSEEAASKANGGTINWVGRGDFVTRYGQNFEDAVWNAAIGDVVGPIQSAVLSADGTAGSYGYYVVQLEGREMRDLTPAQQEAALDKIFDEWLNSQKQARNAQSFATWRSYMPTRPSLTEMGIPANITGQ